MSVELPSQPAVREAVVADLAAAPSLAMVAGEASGDLLASLLIAGLRQRWPSTALRGIGGPRMLAQGGFDAWWPQERLAVRGYVEVLKHYPALARMRRELAQRLIANPPDAFIGVDAPDFNLGLEGRLRAQGVRTIHFICPSIWAWRAGRIDTIKRSVDHMLCIFPFEPALLHPHGVGATYVGHPLADEIAVPPPDVASARRQLGLDERRPTVALLPGSRASEIACMARLFADAARLILQRRADVQFVLPAAPGRRAQINAALGALQAALPVHVIEGRSHDAMAACDVTLIASGTATLEAALLKRPMVIAYRMNGLSYQIMRRQGLLPWIGLPNILARDFLVPERIQHEATPQRLAQDVLAWLDEPARIDALQRRFTDMHHELRRDTARTATDAIAQVLGR